jgi:hypothetical protein
LAGLTLESFTADVCVQWPELRLDEVAEELVEIEERSVSQSVRPRAATPPPSPRLPLSTRLRAPPPRIGISTRICCCCFFLSFNVSSEKERKCIFKISYYRKRVNQ